MENGNGHWMKPLPSVRQSNAMVETIPEAEEA